MVAEHDGEAVFKPEVELTLFLRMRTRDVPNSGLRLFGRIRIRIRIVLPDEHFDTAHTVLIFITSLNSCGCLYGRVCMLPSHDPLPLIRLIVSQNQAF